MHLHIARPVPDPMFFLLLILGASQLCDAHNEIHMDISKMLRKGSGSGFTKEKLEFGKLPPNSDYLRSQIELRECRSDQIFALEGTPTGEYFNVVFATDDESTRPLHLAFHFTEGRVRLWSKDEDRWETEESRNNPIKRNRKFTLAIVSTTWCFKIILNSHFTWCYDYRPGFDEISHIRVSGHIMVEDVGVFYPSSDKKH